MKIKFRCLNAMAYTLHGKKEDKKFEYLGSLKVEC